MNRYLLDTNHASAIFRSLAPITTRIAAAKDAEFALCRPSVGELWYMVFNSAQVERNY